MRAQKILRQLKIGILPLAVAFLTSTSALAEKNEVIWGPLTGEEGPGARLNILVSTLVVAVFKILQVLLPLAGGVAVLMLIIGGIQYMNNAEQGKKTILATIIGLLIIIFAVFIVQLTATQLGHEGEFPYFFHYTFY